MEPREPCSACYELFAVIELHRRDGRCGDCRADRVPPAHHIVGPYTDWRRHGMSTEDAAAAARQQLANEAAADAAQ